MRIFLLLGLFLFLSNDAVSQKPKQSIGVYTSFLKFGSIPTQADQTAITNSKFLIGAEYNRHLNSWLMICGGIEYADDNITRTGQQRELPRYGHVKFVSFPIYLRTDILKYFFFTFGTIVDVKLNNDIINPSSTLGLTGGTGLQIPFKKHFRFFLHPYYQLHNFTGKEASIFNLDIRMGLSYQF